MINEALSKLNCYALKQKEIRISYGAFLLMFFNATQLGTDSVQVLGSKKFQEGECQSLYLNLCIVENELYLVRIL